MYAVATCSAVGSVALAAALLIVAHVAPRGWLESRFGPLAMLVIGGALSVAAIGALV